MSAPEFEPWPKTPRLFRDVVITEKIDGTNAAVRIDRAPVVPERLKPGRVEPLVYSVPDWSELYEDDNMPTHEFLIYAQSRRRFITPAADNQGFAAWVKSHAVTLAATLGEGLHFGEWWGQGIQRGYGLDEKRFSLFNVNRWAETDLSAVPGLHVVPTLYEGPFSESHVQLELARLGIYGSAAAPGYLDPEGVCVFHTASRQVYKVLLVNDEIPKGAAA